MVGVDVARDVKVDAVRVREVVDEAEVTPWLHVPVNNEIVRTFERTQLRFAAAYQPLCANDTTHGVFLRRSGWLTALRSDSSHSPNSSARLRLVCGSAQYE